MFRVHVPPEQLLSLLDIGLTVPMYMYVIVMCTYLTILLLVLLLNEQVAYKMGVAGPKQMAPGSNYCQHGCLVKAKVLGEHRHGLLTIICKSFSQKKAITNRKKFIMTFLHFENPKWQSDCILFMCAIVYRWNGVK